MDAVSWKRISSTRRDWQGLFPFFRADAPTSTVSTAWGVFEDVVLLDSASPAHLICVTLHSMVLRNDNTFHEQVQPFGDIAAEQCFVKGLTTIVDARTHLPRGLEAWELDTHGFCFVRRPQYDFEEHEQQDFRRVNKEFAPKVLECVRQAAGAKNAFWLSHQVASNFCISVRTRVVLAVVDSGKRARAETWRTLGPENWHCGRWLRARISSRGLWA